MKLLLLHILVQVYGSQLDSAQSNPPGFSNNGEQKNNRHTTAHVWIEANIDAEGVKSVSLPDNRESTDAHSSSSSARLASNVESRGHMDTICDSKAHSSFRK